MTNATETTVKAFGLTLEELTESFSNDYGKGPYHAQALFRHLYRTGRTDVSKISEYLKSPDLALQVESDYSIEMPEPGVIEEDSGTLKFTLKMSDESLTESVLIPMSEWDTLCISSQVGCSRGCSFCETARMGLIRNLESSEIVAQWAHTVFKLQRLPRNIVFMGMGEPFDNIENVIRSIRILSDPRGAGLFKRRISISTSGHVDGIRALTALEKNCPEEAWRTVRLAVSLNATDDSTRDSLMPINRKWPLGELKNALMETPQSRIKDGLYFEYVVIPGVNDSKKDIAKLAGWMEGLKAKVNIIPYHPGASRQWDVPDDEAMDRFHAAMLETGIECRTRRSRGKQIEAACGMLGGKV